MLHQLEIQAAELALTREAVPALLLKMRLKQKLVSAENYLI
jgi:hypothetical protein